MEATYQTGVNAFIDLTPLQILTRNIGPCQEMGEFPSLTGVEMLPEARYAVDLLTLFFSTTTATTLPHGTSTATDPITKLRPNTKKHVLWP